MEVDVRRYRKRPAVIEAVRWDGTHEGAAPIVRWVLNNGGKAHYATVGMENGRVMIETLEGPLGAKPGDYVIKGIKGEFYPHAGEFFDEAYEPADDEVEYGHAEYQDNPLVFSSTPKWLLDAVETEYVKPVFMGEDYWYARVLTPEGTVFAEPGDRIVYDADGNLRVRRGGETP